MARRGGKGKRQAFAPYLGVLTFQELADVGTGAADAVSQLEVALAAVIV